MKKRFTDADIWKKAWFRKLSPSLKGLYSYIKDNCDQAGVWEVDWEIASMCIGEKVDQESLKAFEGRAIEFDRDKVLLVDFVKFQNGFIYPAKNNVQKSIASLFEKHGLEQDEETKKVFPRKAGVGQGLVRGCATPLVKVVVKEEVTVKEQVKRNEEVSTNKKTYVLESENVRDLNRSRRFDFFGLDEKLGFKDSDFANILAKGKLTFKQIQESIEYFEHDLSNDKIKKMRGSPRSFFFGILNNGNTYSKNKDFQSKAEVEVIKKAEEDKQKAFEQQQAEEEKQKAEQQNAWDNLPQAEKEKYFEKVRKIIPESFLKTAEDDGVIESDAFKQFVNDLKKSSRSSEQGLYCVMTSSEAEQRRGA